MSFLLFDHFDGDTENAVIFTLGTTVLSVLTIPCIYWLLGVLLYYDSEDAKRLMEYGLDYITTNILESVEGTL